MKFNVLTCCKHYYREDKHHLLATDNSEVPPVVSCSVASGSQFDIGETEVICQALDAGGNQAGCSFYVNVRGTNGIISQCNEIT